MPLSNSPFTATPFNIDTTVVNFNTYESPLWKLISGESVVVGSRKEYQVRNGIFNLSGNCAITLSTESILSVR